MKKGRECETPAPLLSSPSSALPIIFGGKYTVSRFNFRPHQGLNFFLTRGVGNNPISMTWTLTTYKFDFLLHKGGKDYIKSGSI